MWVNYAEPFFKVPQDELVAMTAYAENRSGGVAGMQSVINVIQNRRLYPPRFGYMGGDILTATGLPYHAVCLAYEQFSSFNVGNSQRGMLLRLAEPGQFQASLLNDLSLRTAWNLVQQLKNGTLLDITGGANHYFAIGITPWWVDTMFYRTTIASQKFYASKPFVSQQPQKFLPDLTSDTPEQTDELLKVVIPGVISGL